MKPRSPPFVITAFIIAITLGILSFLFVSGEQDETNKEADHVVVCETTKGSFSIDLYRDWAPRGYDRFMELVRSDFFADQVMYRTMPGFLVQFGVAADPTVQAKWQNRKIADDPDLKIPFKQGTISFAGNGVNSRSSHIFISLEPHGVSLGNALHERPFGRIKDPKEQEVVEAFYSGYGDITHLQSALVQYGNAAAADYPDLDRINRCYVQDDSDDL